MTTFPRWGINTLEGHQEHPGRPERPPIQTSWQEYGSTRPEYLPSKDATPGTTAEHVPVSMCDAMELLKNQSISAQEALRLLFDIEKQIHKPDFAELFCVLGGFDLLKQYSQPTYNLTCRSVCGSIMGTVVEEKPNCQQKALDADMLNIAFELLKDPETEVQRKGLLALSALLRSCQAAQEAFMNRHGLRKLREAMKQSNGDEKFETKVWFLLSILSLESASIADALVQQKFHDDAFENIQRNPDGDSNEFILDLMVELTKNFVCAFSAEYKANWYKFLNEKIQSPKDNWTNEKVLERALTLHVALQNDKKRQEKNGNKGYSEKQPSKVPTNDMIPASGGRSWPLGAAYNVRAPINAFEANKPKVLEVTSKSYGIKNYAGDMEVFIHGGAHIPTEVSQTWQTSVHYQSGAFFEVCEKEIAGNNIVRVEHSFAIYDIPRRLKGEVNFYVVMRINANGLLYVEAVETSSGKRSNIQFFH